MNTELAIGLILGFIIIGGCVYVFGAPYRDRLSNEYTDAIGHYRLTGDKSKLDRFFVKLRKKNKTDFFKDEG